MAKIIRASMRGEGRTAQVGSDYTEQQGGVPYGEVAERYRYGQADDLDYYHSQNERQFTTRKH